MLTRRIVRDIPASLVESGPIRGALAEIIADLEALRGFCRDNLKPTDPVISLAAATRAVLDDHLADIKSQLVILAGDVACAAM